MTLTNPLHQCNEKPTIQNPTKNKNIRQPNLPKGHYAIPLTIL